MKVATNNQVGDIMNFCWLIIFFFIISFETFSQNKDPRVRFNRACESNQNITKVIVKSAALLSVRIEKMILESECFKNKFPTEDIRRFPDFWRKYS